MRAEAVKDTISTTLGYMVGASFAALLFHRHSVLDVTPYVIGCLIAAPMVYAIKLRRYRSQANQP